MADANAVMQAIAGREAQASQYGIDLASLLGTEMEMRNQARDLVTTDANGNTPEMVRQAGIAALQAQERTIGIAKAMGLNNEGTSDLQYELATKQQANIRARMEQEQRIGQLESVGLTDNPIEYLLNQWMLPDEYAKYDGYTNAAAQASKDIQNLQASTSSAAVTSNLIAEKITKATIEDQLRASEDSIAKQKLAYSMENLQSASRYTKELFQLKGGELDRAKELYQIQVTEENMQFQREQAQARRAMERERLDLKAAEAAKAEQNKAAILEYVNAARTKDGLAPVTEDIFTKGLFGSKTGMGQELDKQYNKGIDLLHGAPVQAGTPLETARMLTSTSVPKLSNEHERVANMVKSVVGAEAAKPVAKPDPIDLAASQKIQQQVSDWERGAGGDKNPLRALPLPALDKQASIAANPAWQAYRKLNGAETELNGEDLSAKLKTIMQNKEATPEQVGKLLSDIGITSAAFNNKNTDLMYLTGRQQQALVIPMSIGRSRADQMLFGSGAVTAAGGLAIAAGAGGSTSTIAAAPAALAAVSKFGAAAGPALLRHGATITATGIGAKPGLAIAAAGAGMMYLGQEVTTPVNLLASQAELTKAAYLMLGSKGE